MVRRLLIAIALLSLPVPQSWCQRIDMSSVEAAELFRIGVSTYHRGAFQSAILSFERSLSLKPQDNLVLDWLATANYRAGYVDAATRTWRDLTRTDYDSAAVASRLQYATWRWGLGAELAGQPRWVLAYEIRSRRGEVSAFKRPAAVRPLRDGTLVVTSFAGNHLARLDVNGNLLQTLRGGLYGLDRPFDVLETSDGYIVSEFGARRVVRCNRQGHRTLVYGASTKEAPRLLGPQYLALDSRGYLYVTDWGSGKVQKYEPDGGWVLSFPGTLEEPTGIAVAGDQVYVAERRAGRISVFDDSGNLLGRLGEGSLAAPEGLAFWDEGTLLAVDGRRILAGAIARDAWKEWNDLGGVAKRPTVVSVDVGGSIYVADVDAEKVFVLTGQPNLIVGNNVWIERISGDAFPEVTMAVSVTDRFGRPITGLTKSNFQLTEASGSVAGFNLDRTPVEPAELEVMVVVDGSLETAGLQDPMRNALLALYDELARASRLGFVAGEVPTVLAPAGTTRLRAAEAVARAQPSARWTLDGAIRVGLNELLPGWGRKAVVYLTAGGIGRRSFESFSLAEAAAAMAINHVSFTVVTVGGGALAPELAYLARVSGGAVVGSSSPLGVSGLARGLASMVDPVYVLSYTSGSFPDYGRRYLPVRVEVVSPGTSGGDRSGYFAPVQR